MSSLRSPTTSADYYRKIEQDRARAKREAEAAAEPHVQPEEAAPAPEPAPATEPAPPVVLTTEQRRTLAKTREKLSRATKNKVQADKLDAANAKAHSAKVVARMERAGQL